jgi:hypothetical protein
VSARQTTRDADTHADWVRRHGLFPERSAADQVRALRVALNRLEGKMEQVEGRRLRTTDPASKRRTERSSDRLDNEWRRLQERLDAFPADVIQAVDAALGNDGAAINNNS